MNTNHLTDENIQDIALKNLKEEQLPMHIKECTECKASLKAYQFMMNSMNEIRPESFSFDVSELVMQRIKDAEPESSSVWVYVLASALIIFVTGVLLFFMPVLKPFFELFHSPDSMYNLFVAVTGLCVFAFLMQDVLRQYKQKEKLLLQ